MIFPFRLIFIVISPHTLPQKERNNTMLFCLSKCYFLVYSVKIFTCLFIITIAIFDPCLSQHNIHFTFFHFIYFKKVLLFCAFWCRWKCSNGKKDLIKNHILRLPRALAKSNTRNKFKDLLTALRHFLEHPVTVYEHLEPDIKFSKSCSVP